MGTNEYMLQESSSPFEEETFDIYKSAEEALANVPPIMTQEDWKFLINLWISDGWKVYAMNASLTTTMLLYDKYLFCTFICRK